MVSWFALPDNKQNWNPSFSVFFCLIFWCIDIHSGFEKVNVFLSGEEEKQKVRVRRGKVQQVSFTLKIKKESFILKIKKRSFTLKINKK